MFKDEQNKFRELILKELLNTPKGKSRAVGLKTINALFEENNLKYKVTSNKETSRKSENYSKMYWTIIKL